jgi:leucyl-tRNA---protein transferase
MTKPKDSAFASQDRPRTVVSPIYGAISLDFLVRGDLHDCPYLPGRDASEELFRASDLPSELYHDFMDHGFRRSGIFFYRTACPNCRECRPIRVLNYEFLPSKSQRRVLRKNEDVQLSIAPPRLTREKRNMYSRYLEHQHGATYDPESMSLQKTLYKTSIKTLEVEYRAGKSLVAVSIVDICSRSLSSVYVYYDPEFSARSPGTLAGLKEILWCREQGIPYYYLGFYVKDCPSMNYKALFKPNEIMDYSMAWKWGM